MGSLPNNDSTDLLVGCRKSKGVTRSHDRTAGVLAIVRPCVIVNTCKMYTCESPTQVYLFLVMTFARGRDIDPTALPWIWPHLWPPSFPLQSLCQRCVLCQVVNKTCFLPSWCHPCCPSHRTLLHATKQPRVQVPPKACKIRWHLRCKYQVCRAVLSMAKQVEIFNEEHASAQIQPLPARGCEWTECLPWITIKRNGTDYVMLSSCTY